MAIQTNHNTDTLTPSGSNLTIGKPILLDSNADVSKCRIYANANLGKGGTVPEQVIIGNYTGWSFDIGDDSVITTIVPFDWASGTDITIRIAWCINEAYGTQNGEVRWQADWSCCPMDTSEAVDAPTHTGSDDTGDVNIPGTAYYLTYSDIETIPAASIAAGDHMGLTLSRIALNDGTNPTADPVIVCVGIIYTSNKLGT